MRLKVIVDLIENECSVTEMLRKLALHQSALSQHLRILGDKGIVGGRREGPKICCKDCGMQANP